MGETDSIATVVERRSATRLSTAAARATTRPDAPSTHAVTADRAMLEFESRRAWAFSVGLTVLAAVGLTLVIVIGGDPFAARVHGGAVAVTGLAALVYALFVRGASKYRPWKVSALVYIAILTNGTGYYFWGVYSGYHAAVTVSAYALTSGAGRRTSIGGLTLSIVMHGGLGVAQAAGWIDDRSLVGAPAVPLFSQMLLLGIFQLILVGATLGGEHAFRTMREVLEAHHEALRDLAVRDAQLAEAHEAARHARAPGEGRYTGEQLGRFRLGAILGRGAMGEVYAADDSDGSPCAVKVLAAHLVDNHDAIERFHREARAIANLDVPNIVRMLDVSQPGAPVPYLAMERLDGNDLGVMIKDQPVRELREVVAIVRAVAAGLDAAHGAGVIHRDLKPANVFAATGEHGVVWKILDFGVSKASDDATLTGAQVVGTPGYMAPEQARGGTIDRRVDVYALGVLAYRLLTGRPAVVPGDMPAMIHEVVYKMPPQPSALVPSLPEVVDSVLAVALAKAPDDRFATAGELAAALAEAAAGVLSDVTIDKANAILRGTPWGHWIRGRARNPTMPVVPRRSPQ